jgi:hypothetical protein
MQSLGTGWGKTSLKGGCRLPSVPIRIGRDRFRPEAGAETKNPFSPQRHRGTEKEEARASCPQITQMQRKNKAFLRKGKEAKRRLSADDADMRRWKSKEAKKICLTPRRHARHATANPEPFSPLSREDTKKNNLETFVHRSCSARGYAGQVSQITQIQIDYRDSGKEQAPLWGRQRGEETLSHAAILLRPRGFEEQAAATQRKPEEPVIHGRQRTSSSLGTAKRRGEKT